MTAKGASPATLGSVIDSLMEIGEIGAVPGGGITRVAWSPELLAAYDWTAERMRALGLDVEIDEAGNLIGRWNVGAGKPVAVGSHLDTVPSGGHFDGVLGVVTALHAVDLLQSEGFVPSRPLWVVAFMDEEGTRFDAALFGSRAFVGDDVSGLAARVDVDGVPLRSAMAKAGFDFERVTDANRVGELQSYFELHIEQGPVLESAGADIGIVTSIVGLRGYRVRLTGQANHAGTTPMHLRRDALAGAARVALELRDYARRGVNLTANVGKISVEPGGANVVPGVADFTIDARATAHDDLAQLEQVIGDLVARVAAEERLSFDLAPTFSLDPLEIEPRIVADLAAAAAAEGATVLRLPSGAGHDAMIVGRHIPAGMIFVPSINGVSHSPEERTEAAHLELGTRVLASALRQSLRAG